MALLRFLPSAGRAPRALIVVLHGVGGDAVSMVPLAQTLAGTLKDTAIIVPDAPFPFDLGTSGYQWFSVAGVTLTNRDARIQNALPGVKALIEHEAKRLGLTHDCVGVCGFSQGAMMALAMADLPHAPRLIASIAGRIARKPEVSTTALPQVFLTHGDSDQTVPYACMNEAIIAFRQSDFQVTALTMERQDHFISAQQTNAVADFFASSFQRAFEAAF